MLQPGYQQEVKLQCQGQAQFVVSDHLNGSEFRFTILPDRIDTTKFTVTISSCRPLVIHPVQERRELIKIEEDQVMPPLVPPPPPPLPPSPSPSPHPPLKSHKKRKTVSVAKNDSAVANDEMDNEVKQATSLWVPIPPSASAVTYATTTYGEMPKFSPISWLLNTMGKRPWTQELFTDQRLSTCMKEFTNSPIYTLINKKSLLSSIKKQIRLLNLHPLWFPYGGGKPNMSDWPLFHSVLKQDPHEGGKEMKSERKETKDDQKIAEDVLFSLPRTSAALITKVFVRCFAKETKAQAYVMHYLRVENTKIVCTEQERYFEAWCPEFWHGALYPEQRYRLTCTCTGSECKMTHCPFAIAQDYMKLCRAFPSPLGVLFRKWSTKSNMLLSRALPLTDIQQYAGLNG